MGSSARSQSEILLKSGTNELEIITLYLRWLDTGAGGPTKTAYGINAAKVRELVAMPSEVTAVPDSPHAVKGVFLLRDRTIPLVDLCDWFGYEADVSEETIKGTVVVITEINTKIYGFIVHGVDKVHRVSWESIIPPPELIAQQSSITGVCLLGSSIIQMVDFEEIVASIDPSSGSDVKDLTAEVPASKHSKKILVAEDSPTAQKQLNLVLTSAGYEVITHSDGLSCWEWLESAREQGLVANSVAAVVSDIEMPRMDGLHLCTRIKEQPAYNSIPVMLFSSLINDTVRHKGESVGADDQISKSELDDLVGRLEACMAKKTGNL